jgi:hypothetical protein
LANASLETFLLQASASSLMGTGPVTGIDVMKGKDKEAVQRPWRESVQDRLTALYIYHIKII